jgi:hypothetical protein
VACGDITGVDTSVVTPGTGSATSPAAFTTIVMPSLTLNPGDLVFSGGLEPGATGTATLTPTVGVTHQTDLYEVNESIIFNPATRTVNPTNIQWDYEVAAGAVEGSTIGLKFYNGDCDVSPQQHDQDIEYVTPAITSVEWLPYEDMLSTQMKIYGTGFRTGAIINTTGAISLVSVDLITPTVMTITVDNGSPGPATVEVENLDTKVSGPFALTILTELAPVFHSSYLDPATEGTSTTVRINGTGLTPPGAVYTFTGLAGAIQVLALSNYLEFTGTITAAVGNAVTLGITSTSHVHPDMDVDIVKATAGGDVVIHDVSNPTPIEHATSVELIFTGENLDRVITVEAEVVDADRQALRYVPTGATVPVVVSITEKRPDTLVLSLDIEKGLAYNEYDFSFYDVGMVLLATAPAAIELQPSSDAPVISKVTRAALDLAIPSTGGSLWTAVIKIDGASPWMFGDEILGVGFTINSQTFNGTTSEWTVEGTNDPPGADWMLTVSRPGILGTEEANYRIPTGATT